MTIVNRYDVVRFLRDAQRLLHEHEDSPTGLEAIGECLWNIGRQAEISARVRSSAPCDAGVSFVLARRANGLRALTLAQVAMASPTLVHDHNQWGVSCVIQGRLRCQRWEHVDARAPHDAQRRLVWERELRTGDTIWFGPPPHDIHRHQAIDDAAWVLTFHGRHLSTRPRQGQSWRGRGEPGAVHAAASPVPAAAMA